MRRRITVRPDRRRAASGLVDPPAPGPFVVALAGLLFAVVFALSALVNDQALAVTVLYALPVAIIGIGFGLAGGLVAGGIALGLFAIWAAGWNADGEQGAVDYLFRGIGLIGVGAVAGLMGRRARSVASRSSRFWTLSTDLLCTVDMTGRFRRLNPAWEETLGWSREELHGTEFIELVHPEDRAATREEFQRLQGQVNVTSDFENRYRTVEGEYRTLAWAAVSSLDDGGVIYAIARDASRRRRAEEALLAAREEAERANQAKSEFLSRMSHELRTPLNAIIGFAELLELESLERRERESVDHILAAAEHLLELVNEALDISRIESGWLPIEPQAVALEEIVLEAEELVAPIARKRQVTIGDRCIEGREIHVHADRQRLTQVLLNLLTNAINYNRPGGEVRIEAEPEQSGSIAVRVIDTGVGIERDQLQRVFEPFTRMRTGDDDVHGTGLGLTLCRGLMDAMGGSIEVDSEFGRGTTVTLRLPASVPAVERQAAAGPPAPAASGVASTAKTVLYVEDDQANLRLVESALARLPAVDLLSATQGGTGLELARRERPDLILLDLHLPDIDGAELLAELRSDPATTGIPVVVVSADATPRRIEQLTAAGASDYLTKPIEIRRLLAIVAGDDPAAP